MKLLGRQPQTDSNLAKLELIPENQTDEELINQLTAANFVYAYSGRKKTDNTRCLILIRAKHTHP